VRLRFVQDVHRPGWSVAEVYRRYQVSRKTGYKWLERITNGYLSSEPFKAQLLVAAAHSIAATNLR